MQYTYKHTIVWVIHFTADSHSSNYETLFHQEAIIVLMY